MSVSLFSWVSYQIRKIAGCARAGNPGNDFPATDFKRNCLLAIPACITARASCTCRYACRGRLTRDGGENVHRNSRRMRNPQFTYLARVVVVTLFQANYTNHGNATNIVIDVQYYSCIHHGFIWMSFTYTPVYNLLFISKLIEGIVCVQ